MDLEKVLIIDLGGNFTQLIARKVRDKKVYSEIIPVATPLEIVKERRAKAIIVSGGQNPVSKEIINLFDREIFKMGVPVMLVGFAINTLFAEEDYLDAGKDSFSEVPNGYEKYYADINEGLMAIIKRDSALIGTLSCPGYEGVPEDILDDFLFNMAALKPEWTPKKFIDDMVKKIKEELSGSEKAVCGLSGGIDSVVSALLVHKAIGERLTCIFVDHGLMRQDEPLEVVETFQNDYNLRVIAVDAADEFISKLKGISDPEEKRHIIGEHFIRVFEKEAKALENVDYLVQGTIYPDIVESISPSGEVIKSHHNVGGLPEKMDLKLIEPVKELFKDEVRKVGKELGLPDEIVWRQPFPGPGLGVRILGEITPEKIEICRKANHILEEEIKSSGLDSEIWQYFAVLPDIKSVGVSGDRRTYAYPLILRAVTSIDAMTAQWYRFPHEILDRISRRIVEEIPEVNRVVYDITAKPPATIEWE